MNIIEKWKRIMQYKSSDGTLTPIPEEDYELCATQLEEAERKYLTAGYNKADLSPLFYAILHEYKNSPKIIVESLID